MYTPPSSDKIQLVRQISIYVLMTLSIVVTVTLLIFYILGYRFDSAAGTIEQGGLVQFDSIPNGANVMVDSAQLGGSTPTKTTLISGTHTTSIAKNEYHTWQKTVDVKGGTILWLNYARLIPKKLTVSTVADLPAVTSTVASPNRKFIALTTEAAEPIIPLAVISGDTAALTTLTLPETSFTAPADKAGETFTLLAWDASSRYVLLKHHYADKTEWIVADTQHIANSKNLTSLFDVEVSDAKFSQSDSKIIYALMNGDIRKIDTDAATISAPLVRGVAEFSLYDRSTLTYVTTIDPTTKHRSVGYYQDGADSPRTLRTYSDDGSLPLHISIGKYYSQTYVGIAYGTTLDILSGALPNSDSNDASSLAAVATVTVPAGVDYLSNRTNGRFVVAQHGMSYSTYDLELQKFTTTTLAGTGPLTGELRWIDGYTVWSDLGGTLRFSEFDGENQHDIMPIIPGQSPALTQNNRYLYAPTKDSSGAVHLSRVRLIL